MRGMKWVLAALLGLTLSASVFAQSGGNFSPTQVKNIEKIVRGYLMKNPQILLEISQELRKQQAEKAQSAALTAIKANKKDLFNNPASPVAGNPNGSVTLVEFFDYQCGHCKSMNATMKTLLKNNKNLKVVFKEFPIFGEASRFAAQAALASNQQGKYFVLHEALLAAKNPLNKEKVLDLATKAGLNVSKLTTAMEGKVVAAQLRDNYRLAQALKLVGTPAFVISNKDETKFKFIPGAVPLQVLQSGINGLK